MKNIFLRSLLVFVSVALAGCNHMFYYPSQKVFFDPEKMGYKYERRFYEVDNGRKILAWFFPSQGEPYCKAKNSKTLIIHFHGNAENISTHFLQLAWVSRQGVEYLIFDYPGYGESGGRANRKEIHADSKALLRQILKKEKSGRQIILYGQSLGGAVLLGVLADLVSEGVNVKDSVHLVILESTFVSYRDIARKKMSDAWITWPFQWLVYPLITDQHSAKKDLNKLAGISFHVLHGERDAVVPFSEGKGLYGALPEPKSFWPVPMAGHMGVLAADTGVAARLFDEKICTPTE